MKNPYSRENCFAYLKCINCDERACYCCADTTARGRALMYLRNPSSSDFMCFDCRGMDRRSPLKKIKYIPASEVDQDRGKPYSVAR